MDNQDVVRRAIKLAREHIEQAAASVDRKPSEAKKEAGNYNKGHFVWNGLSIAIENPKGSIRRGTDSKGTAWTIRMPAHYGYLKRSIGADDDHIDVYMGSNPLSKDIWVIDQIHARTGKFDEHKVMLGFTSRDEALAAYRKAFSDGRGDDRMGGVSKMTLGQLKRWLAKGNTTEPLSA